jgi:hypothetical protein
LGIRVLAPLNRHYGIHDDGFDKWHVRAMSRRRISDLKAQHCPRYPAS